MECNKDEALRAKEIAERKVTQKDYAGAKKFALKAQNLFPGLDGISQILTTLDVYISAENKVSGEADWYGVLGVSQLADDEAVKKQYRKLALMLHPDKNKFVGADGAFKLVSEAWTLLSDQAKRLAYNQRINFRGLQQKFHTQSGVSSMPSRTNGSHSRVGETSFAPVDKKPVTFWTICNRCKTQYEYIRVYLNHTLLCPNCNVAFLAVEKAPPQNSYQPSSRSTQQQQASRHHDANNNQNNYGTNSSISQNDRWAQEKVKRQREEALKAERLLKKRKDGNYVSGYAGNMATQTPVGNGHGFGNTTESRSHFGMGTGSIYGYTGNYNKHISERELSLFEIRNMLMDKALGVICEKLKDWSSVTEAKNGDKVKGKSMANGVGCGTNNDSQVKQPPPTNSPDDPDRGTGPLSINVPDSDFHDFDLDRSESSFEDDQVWAAYDADDGMPRFYARVHKVISLKPFKMKISWLNSRSSSEFGELDWIGSGFTKTCGEFRCGRHEISRTLNSFSHKVQWTKGMRGVIRIFPRKGDVWALYRNWSPDWNESTPDYVRHKYDMVEVIDDYDEEQGVSVVPLIKVSGFKTVFQKHIGLKEVRRIPREEMFRFSHQVPNYLLTGQEADNAPTGCRELDPASTSLELLQVIIEADKAPVDEEMLQC